MRKAFIVGHPVAHSRSPLIHGHWLARHGITGSYDRVNVGPQDFETFFRGLPASGYVGGNVTIPHKEAAFRLSDEVSETARRIGAVNTLLVRDGRVEGDNTDAHGFVAHCDASLGAGWVERHGGNALVLGAGGAARAIVVGLLERGFARVVVANRTWARVEALTGLDPDRMSACEWAALPAELPRTTFLVNTTSLGMAGEGPLDVGLDALPEGAAVADIVYVPLTTPLLAAARARRLPTVDGLGMLLHQAVPGFARWFGTSPEVTAELHDLVAADIPAR